MIYRQYAVTKKSVDMFRRSRSGWIKFRSLSEFSDSFSPIAKTINDIANSLRIIPVTNVEFLIVAGGGGGGSTWANSGGGGGGSGGVVYRTEQGFNTLTNYSISVGAGGRGDQGGYSSGGSSTPATNGSNSTGFG